MTSFGGRRSAHSATNGTRFAVKRKPARKSCDHRFPELMVDVVRKIKAVDDDVGQVADGEHRMPRLGTPGGDADRTIEFGLDGVNYTIDLIAEAFHVKR